MLEKVANFIGESPIIQGMLMTAALTVLRLHMDSKKQGWRAGLLEVLTCVCMAFAFSPLITWAGMPENVNIAVGAGVGVAGSMQVKALFLRFMTKKADA